MPALKAPRLSPEDQKKYAPAQAPLVDKKIVAADLGVGTRTIERWVASRRIPFIRLGHRQLRFQLDAVRRAVARWETKEIA
jgi:excisionase family DNA binding protein